MGGIGGSRLGIRFAKSEDAAWLVQYDKHISEEEMGHAILRNRVYIAEKEGRFVGWLRYNLFWDNIPFMNMLYVMEEYRGSGGGRKLVEFWESEMERQGYSKVMTSTQANEYAQHFYIRLGYEAIGGFLLGSEPYEILFAKEIRHEGNG